MPLLGVPLVTTEGMVAGRVRLRPQLISDVPLLQQLSREPDVVRWTTYPANLDIEGARARIAQAEAVADRAVFCVAELDDRPAGTCGASAGDAEGAIEVFYAVLPWARRQGVATTAISLLVSAAGAAGAESILLETHLDNAGSQAVARRAGFVEVGSHRRMVKGVYTDVLVWRSQR